MKSWYISIILKYYEQYKQTYFDIIILIVLLFIISKGEEYMEASDILSKFKD